jgi:hypothetical protein
LRLNGHRTTKRASEPQKPKHKLHNRKNKSGTHHMNADTPAPDSLQCARSVHGRERLKRKQSHKRAEKGCDGIKPHDPREIQVGKCQHRTRRPARRTRLAEEARKRTRNASRHQEKETNHK